MVSVINVADNGLNRGLPIMLPIIADIIRVADGARLRIVTAARRVATVAARGARDCCPKIHARAGHVRILYAYSGNAPCSIRW